MAQPVAHVRAPRTLLATDRTVERPAGTAAPRAAGAPHPAAAAPHEQSTRRGPEFVIDDSTLDPTTIALAAARADVIRIRLGAGLPTYGAVRALVAMLDDEVAAVGRDRDDLVVVLEVEAVVAADRAEAARRRGNLAYVAAFSHVAWQPDETMIVAPLDALADEVAAVVRRTRVDAVDLALVGPSRHLAPQVTAALTR